MKDFFFKSKTVGEGFTAKILVHQSDKYEPSVVIIKRFMSRKADLKNCTLIRKFKDLYLYQELIVLKKETLAVIATQVFKEEFQDGKQEQQKK